MVAVNDVANDEATNNQYPVHEIGTHDGEYVEYVPSVHIPYVLQGPNAPDGHILLY